MRDDAEVRKTQATALFNRLATEYDATGCFAHFGRRLVELVGVKSGERVLDVATGRGAVLFPAAEGVGETGKVVGIDLAEGMVRATNEEAQRRGITPQVRVMDAEQLEFCDATFDRVLCGFGVMSFPNLGQALSEFHRVLKPGGRVGISTWRASESSDLGVVLRELGLGRGAPPGWISEPDELAGHLRQAGFAEVRVIVDTATFHYADLGAYWQGARGTGQRASLDALDDVQTERVRVALAERLRQYQGSDGFHVPSTALLAVADR